MDRQHRKTRVKGWNPTFDVSLCVTHTLYAPIPNQHWLVLQWWLFAVKLRSNSSISPFSLSLSPGGLCLWLVLWLVVLKPGGVGACPRLCVCYPMPMTVSCQSQNLTIVPAGVPYDSQRVFLQNNRITELRADSFGFETQVKMAACLWYRFSSSLFSVFASSHFFIILCRCFGYTETTSHGSRPELSVTWGYWRSSIWVITPFICWKVEPSGVWKSCRACTCIAASWLLSPMTSSTSCIACSSSTCR